MQLPTIAEANNHAIVLMQRGQYALAIEKLREAQFYAMQYVHPSGDATIDTTTNQTIITAPNTFKTNDINTSPTMEEAMGSVPQVAAMESNINTCSFVFGVPATVNDSIGSNRDINESHDTHGSGKIDTAVSPHNAFSMYNQAFVLMCSDGASFSTPGDEALGDCMTVGATLLFNTALALHFYGLSLSGKPVSLPMLRNAQKLYKLTVSMLDETLAFAGLHNYPTHLQVMLMAAYSNAGHVHSHLMDDNAFVVDCQHQIQSLYTRVSEEVLEILSLPENAHISMTFVWNSMLPSLQPSGQRFLAPAA